MERRENELARRTGIKRHWTIRTEDEATRHIAAMAIVDEEIGFSAVNDKMEALECRLDPVMRIILDTPAHDLLGVALKANAVARTMPELWTSTPSELDHPQELLRDLIENLCAVAGVNLVANQHLTPRKDLN